MPLKHVYVDESLSSGGTGTSVDPYSSLALALSSESQNTAGGTQFNIKSLSSGGSSVVQSTSDNLDSQITWSPSYNDPVIFRGYNTTENDGGIFDWDLNNRTATFLDKGFVNFVDGKIHNSGTMPQLCTHQLNNRFINIHFDDLSCTSTLIRLRRGGELINCHISNCTSDTFQPLVRSFGDSDFIGNFFDGTNCKGYSFLQTGPRGFVIQNILVIPSQRTSSVGFYLGIELTQNSDSMQSVANNSFLKLGKTSSVTAIKATSTGFESSNIFNNLFEGFDQAISLGSEARGSIYAGNTFYDNTSNIDNDNMGLISTANETLASSPFEKSGTLSYVDRAQYFAPADIGNVRTGGYSPHGAGSVTRGAIPFSVLGGTSGTSNSSVGGTYNPHPLLG